MQVVIIGTGNVATILGKAIKAAGHTITGVLGRDMKKAADLADSVGAKHIGNFDSEISEADIYIIAVSDASIAGLAKVLKLSPGLVVHTAGSVPMEVLKDFSPNYGILYPLQSLRKELTTIPKIPFLIDGNTPDNRTIIHDLAITLSDQVRFGSNEDRFHFHLSAILVSNFTNHLYALAADFCKEKDLPFSFLQPLIGEVVSRLELGHPSQFQTGPAVRNDQPTINRHLEALEDHPELKNLYAVFTNYIQAYYNNKG